MQYDALKLIKHRKAKWIKNRKRKQNFKNIDTRVYDFQVTRCYRGLK